jgi:hypothetical protein
VRAQVCEETEQLADLAAGGLEAVPTEAFDRRFSWQAYVKAEDSAGLGGMCASKGSAANS